MSDRGHRAFQCNMLLDPALHPRNSLLTLERIFGPEQSMYYTRSLLDLKTIGKVVYSE
jgi:hypothetical protein